jgi:hypothetical protein
MKPITMSGMYPIATFSFPRLTIYREGKIMSRPNGIPELNDHPTEAFELVVRVYRPPFEKEADPSYVIKSFGDRAAANKAYKEDSKQ